MGRRIAVVVADDELLVRRALTVFLEDDADISVVGTAENGEEAVDLAARLQPDVVLMDLQMPRMDGIEATRRIAAEWPGVRVIAVTTFGTLDSIIPVLRAGASGYLLKDSDPQAIVAAVRLVHQGSSALSPRIAEKLVEHVAAEAECPPARLAPHEALSPREEHVVALLARGRSNAEIARDLHISEGTVKSHLSSVMVKWGVRDRVQVLVRAARAGVVDFSS